MIKKIIKKIVPLKIRIKLREKLEGYQYGFYKLSRSFNKYKFEESYDNQVVVAEIENFKRKPEISIVIPFIENSSGYDAVESLKKQLYKNIELLMATEPVSINDLLFSAKGEYVGILYAKDELASGAIYELVKLILEKEPDIIYTDNDFFQSKNKYINPNYKPDFSPFALLSKNYINDFCLFKTKILQAVLSQQPLKNCEHYDLILKMVENTEKIEHIPKVLYHTYWGDQSECLKEERKKTVEQALKRRSITGELVETSFEDIIRVKRRIEGNPLVSIIIPFKDKPELLTMCLDSVLNRSTYKNYEVIGISNNSKEDRTFERMKHYSKKDARIRFYEHNIPFNFSTLNNFAVSKINGEQLILLNNDIEIISPDWIEALLEYSQLPEVGVVGAKLYYPNNKIQHAGIIMGIRGLAGHSHKLADRKEYGYQGRLNITQEISAVTAACLMVKTSLYKEAGGMDEKLSVAYNDLDFCLKIQEKGFKNIFTPYCEAFHHESISRGVEDTPEKIQRLNFEMDYIKNRYKKIVAAGDPYYNINLTLEREDFSGK
jgi:GT2 family glycosyltransferase